MAPHGHTGGLAAVPPVSATEIQPRGTNGQSQVNGFDDRQDMPKGRLPHRHKLLDVDQALQYSPFSSIVPFDPGTSFQPSVSHAFTKSTDVVPMPNSNLPGFSSVFSNLSERQAAKHQFEELNHEFAKNPGTSSAAHRAKTELKRLLDPVDAADLYLRC